MQLDDGDRQFIAALGSMMERWGLPPSTGRLYGYLLLNSDPVDLDTMVADLGSSKSGLSIAARQLESWFLVRRIPLGGSRRITYEVDGDIDRLLAMNSIQVKRFSDVLRSGASTAQGTAATRLASIADMFELYVAASGQALAERLGHEPRTP